MSPRKSFSPNTKKGSSPGLANTKQIYLATEIRIGFKVELRDGAYYARDVAMGGPAWLAGLRNGYQLKRYMLEPSTKNEDRPLPWSNGTLRDLSSFCVEHSSAPKIIMIQVKTDEGIVPPWDSLHAPWVDREKALKTLKGRVQKLDSVESAREEFRCGMIEIINGLKSVFDSPLLPVPARVVTRTMDGTTPRAYYPLDDESDGEDDKDGSIRSEEQNEEEKEDDEYYRRASKRHRSLSYEDTVSRKKKCCDHPSEAKEDSIEPIDSISTVKTFPTIERFKTVFVERRSGASYTISPQEFVPSHCLSNSAIVLLCNAIAEVCGPAWLHLEPMCNGCIDQDRANAMVIADHATCIPTERKGMLVLVVAIRIDDCISLFQLGAKEYDQSIAMSVGSQINNFAFHNTQSVRISDCKPIKMEDVDQGLLLVSHLVGVAEVARAFKGEALIKQLMNKEFKLLNREPVLYYVSKLVSGLQFGTDLFWCIVDNKRFPCKRLSPLLFPSDSVKPTNKNKVPVLWLRPWRQLIQEASTKVLSNESEEKVAITGGPDQFDRVEWVDATTIECSFGSVESGKIREFSKVKEPSVTWKMVEIYDTIFGSAD